MMKTPPCYTKIFCHYVHATNYKLVVYAREKVKAKVIFAKK